MQRFLFMALMLIASSLGVAVSAESPRELTLEEMHDAVRNDRLMRNGVKYTITSSPGFGNLLTGGAVSVGTVLADGTIVDSYNQKKVVGHLRDYIPSPAEEAISQKEAENKYFAVGEEKKYFIETTASGDTWLYRKSPLGAKVPIGIVKEDGTLLDKYTGVNFERRVIGHVTDYIPDWKKK